MSVVINGTGSISGLSNVGGIASAQSGSIIQTVFNYSTSIVSTNSTSYSTTSFSASITPQFSTSKILVMFAGQAYVDTKNCFAYLAIYRGGGSIYSTGALLINSAATTSSMAGTPTLIYQDSPATTSSTTYTMYFKVDTGAIFYLDGQGASPYSLTLMEIAA